MAPFLTAQTKGPSLVQGHLAIFFTKLPEAKQDEWNTDGTSQVSQDAVSDLLGSEIATDRTLRAPTKNKSLTPQRKKALLKQFPYVRVKLPSGN